MKYWCWRKQSQVWRQSAIHFSKRGHFWKLLFAWCHWDKIFAASETSVAPIPAERSLAYWTFLRLLSMLGDSSEWWSTKRLIWQDDLLEHRSGLDEKSFMFELKVLVQDNGKEIQSTQNCLQQSCLVFLSLSVFWRSFCTLKGRRWVTWCHHYYIRITKKFGFTKQCISSGSYRLCLVANGRCSGQCTQCAVGILSKDCHCISLRSCSPACEGESTSCHWKVLEIICSIGLTNYFFLPKPADSNSCYNALTLWRIFLKI